MRVGAHEQITIKLSCNVAFRAFGEMLGVIQIAKHRDYVSSFSTFDTVVEIRGISVPLSELMLSTLLEPENLLFSICFPQFNLQVFH